MALHSGFARQNGILSTSYRDAFQGVVPAATKSGKGFGGVRKSEEHKPKREGGQDKDRKAFKEAAAAITTHRPVKAEEAARGKLDYVQVADWGSGDRAKLGELRLVSHMQQYEGSASGTSDAAAAAAAGGRERSGVLPFHMQLARQLQMAEARGALSVAGPPPPAVSEWSFREDRYVQYLEDQLAVHQALEGALLEAITNTNSTNINSTDADDTSGGGASRVDATTAALQPAQGAVHALRHLAPGRLGLERSAAIRRDLAALHATVKHPADAAAVTATRCATADLGSLGAAKAEDAAVAGAPAGEAASGREPDAQSAPSALSSGECSTMAGPMARSYVQVLRRLGRVAAAGECDEERQSGALRLLAHAAVMHMAAQAVWVRLGATATERLALLQRRAAAVYHEYPEEVTDPRVTLSRALDAASEHLRSPAARQVVFDEVAGAMQKTGLLLSALAHRD